MIAKRQSVKWVTDETLAVLPLGFSSVQALALNRLLATYEWISFASGSVGSGSNLVPVSLLTGAVRVPSSLPHVRSPRRDLSPPYRPSAARPASDGCGAHLMSGAELTDPERNVDGSTKTTGRQPFRLSAALAIPQQSRRSQ
jgi:hypothetical protein